MPATFFVGTDRPGVGKGFGVAPVEAQAPADSANTRSTSGLRLHIRVIRIYRLSLADDLVMPLSLWKQSCYVAHPLDSLIRFGENNPQLWSRRSC